MTPEEQQKQIMYRDARYTGQYDNIWQSVGKCVFCDMRDKYIFHEENGVVMTVAMFAYTDGHLMIIPRRHVRSVKELTPLEWETMRKFMYLAKKLIRQIYGIKGMQIVQKDGAEAQSTVEHLHFHCIPFDSPDLCEWKYRQLANTPLENAQLYKSKSSVIADLSGKFETVYSASLAVNDMPEAGTTGQGSAKELYRDALKQALRAKRRSVSKIARVGAAIIAGGKIVADCNADLEGGEMEADVDGKLVSNPSVSHAEEKCIALAARDGIALVGATMIVTLSPCMMCARMIVNSGLAELHYVDDWWDQKSLEFLTSHGVKVKKIKKAKPKEGSSGSTS